MDINKVINKYLNKVGYNLVQDAKNNAPVKTGALRDSIDKKVEGDSVIVGSDLFYSVFIEVGTSKMPPKSFLRRALYNRNNYRA